MAKNLYVGVGSKARKVKALYVGVGGKARKVKKVYVGVGGKARLVYQSYIPVTGISYSYKTYYDSKNTVAFYLTFLPSNASDTSYTISVQDQNSHMCHYTVYTYLSNGFVLKSNEVYNFNGYNCQLTITTKDGIAKTLTCVFVFSSGWKITEQ